MKRILLLALTFSWMVLNGQDRYAQIDGQRFRFRTMGSGTTTVIFESGMSDSLETWGSIPDSVARFARVFLYDRADIGKSDSSREPRTIPNMVKELQVLLKHEKISPPYILAGHSLGGYITRYFTAYYPDEVKGLLLLDPSPEAYWKSMSKKELNNYIKGGTEWYRTRFKPQYRKEWYQFIPNMVYVNDLKIPETMPVILVSATETNWFRFQSKQIEGLKNARQVELKGKHHIYKEYPELIVKYIRELTE